MNKKLFVFDVDGTLLPSSYTSMPASTVSSINALLKQGHVVTIDSGRPFGGIKQFLDVFTNGEKYVIAANGAALYDKNGNALFQKTMSIDVLIHFKNRFLKKNRDVYAYSLTNCLYLFGPTISSWANWEITANQMPNYIDLNKTPLNKDTQILKVMVCGDSKWISKVPFNKEEKNNYNIVVTGDEYLEILPSSINKAVPIALLAEKLKINKEDIYCFGDGQNDIEMLKEYHGVAMGEATIEAKNAATYISKCSYEDGIYYALKNILKFI